MPPKKAVAKKKTAAPKRGRPPVAFRKKSFHLLLDPRYIEHLKEKAEELGISPMDLGRFALNSVFPDPFNPGINSELARRVRHMASAKGS